MGQMEPSGSTQGTALETEEPDTGTPTPSYTPSPLPHTAGTVASEDKDRRLTAMNPTPFLHNGEPDCLFIDHNLPNLLVINL